MRSGSQFFLWKWVGVCRPSEKFGPIRIPKLWRKRAHWHTKLLNTLTWDPYRYQIPFHKSPLLEILQPCTKPSICQPPVPRLNQAMACCLLSINPSPEPMLMYCYSMMTSSNGNIFRVTGPLCGEFTGPRWIPRAKRPVTRSFDVFFTPINGWVNNREAGDLRRYRARYDPIINFLKGRPPRFSLNVHIAGTLGCLFIDNETHESGVTKCTTGEAWSAFSWHHSSVFHCQWTHNQVFLLLSHMLI